LPGPAANDPRIDLEETLAGVSSGDEAGAQHAADAADKKGRERGSDLLIAEAKLVEPMAKLPRFVADQEDARRICQNAGNMDCVGQAWLRIGQSQNPKPAAKTAIEQALAIFGRLGDQRRYSEAQSALGVLFMDRGDFAAGHRQFAAARATCEKIGDRSCVAKQVLNDGNIDYASGEVASAETKYREALALARETGENQLIWGSLNNLASLLTDYDGNLSQAESLYRELVEMDRKSGKEARMNFTLSNLGAAIAAEGRLEEARSMLKGVESWAVKNGQRPEFGSSAITLAQIDLAEGRPVDAEARLRTMAKILEDENSTFAISYYNYIASAQLAQNHALEAEKTLAHARSLLTDSNQAGFDSDYLAITETQAAVALHPDDARVRDNSLVKLSHLASRCQRKGITDVELEARLAEGQIEVQSDLRPEGTAHLASLERDAASKGFGLIARQAAASGK
jgi:tetratricopeptide (TPR) repeat protein